MKKFVILMLVFASFLFAQDSVINEMKDIKDKNLIDKVKELERTITMTEKNSTQSLDDGKIIDSHKSFYYNENSKKIRMAKLTSTITLEDKSVIRINKTLYFDLSNSEYIDVTIKTEIGDNYWISNTKFDKQFSTLFALKGLLNLNDYCNPYIITRHILEKKDDGGFNCNSCENLLMYDVLSLVDVDTNGMPIFRLHSLIDNKFIDNSTTKEFKYLAYNLKISF